WLPRPPRSPFFPYTTLFRSVLGRLGGVGLVIDREVFDLAATELAAVLFDELLETVGDRVAERGVSAGVGQHEANLDLVLGVGRRSEEHTSELQSRENLVCRL